MQVNEKRQGRAEEALTSGTLPPSVEPTGRQGLDWPGSMVRVEAACNYVL